MNFKINTIYKALVMSTALLLTLQGCGSGSSSSPPAQTLAPVAAKTIVTGVAATGAPIAGGAVTLKDASPTAVLLSLTTASDGTFTFDTAKITEANRLIDSAASAVQITVPVVLKTVSGSKNFYAMANADTPYANINPLSTIVVSVAAGGPANLDKWFAAATPEELNSTMRNLPSAEATVLQYLKPLLDNYSVTSILNQFYSADHTGMDGMFDGIDISLVGNTVKISVKVLGKVTDVVIFSGSTIDLSKGVLTIANIPNYVERPLGVKLYMDNCASCHGDIYNSTLSGKATAATVATAISTGRGGMGYLSRLNADEIAAIVSAIPPRSVADSSNGASLYAINCSSCHKELSVSDKKGTTVTRIQQAISSNLGGMAKFGSNNTNKLSLDDLNAIVIALNPFIPCTGPSCPGASLDGKDLYLKLCSTCHNPLATTTKAGLTIERFYAAVTTAGDSKTAMGYLSTLSIEELQAIISVMPPLVVDGATLYKSKCETCHRPLATSTKGGVTAKQINYGIAYQVQMASLSTLNPIQIDSIAAVLKDIKPYPVTDGPSLYASNCESCHGPLETSAKWGATVARIDAGIASIKEMSPLVTLSAAQRKLISDALLKVPQPAVNKRGETLYADNCAKCHGALAVSTKGGAPASSISFSISNTPQMQAETKLALLTPTDVNDIAAALAAVIRTVPADGPGLYEYFCSACHNPLATTTKGGATEAQISAAIKANRGGMASLASTTIEQRNLIAAELAKHAAPKCGTCHEVDLSKLKTGRHRTHIQEAENNSGFTDPTSCGICHGDGYTTSNNKLPIHNNGVNDVTTLTTTHANPNGLLRWIPPTRDLQGVVTAKGTCQADCHNKSKRTW